ncbi:MAG: RNA 2',3'-cyclic phosphodiesterase [Blastocatellia bacterium]|nr:RNA 2',3'-cyclic phosphodiesterase [Blastocatellia bacterium]
MSESSQKRDRKNTDALRTFICIEITEAIKGRIADLQDSLRSAGAQVSWVKAANIHLTLKFLGDVQLSRIESILRAAERAAASISPFEIEVSGAGCFPSPRNPRVLWVGLANVPEELKRLHAGLEAELAREGFPREQKNFSPHLTICRIRSPRNASRVAEDLIARGFEAESFQAREIIVMRSDLKPAGAIYTPQAVIKLGGIAADKKDMENR